MQLVENIHLYQIRKKETGQEVKHMMKYMEKKQKNSVKIEVNRIKVVNFLKNIKKN